MNFVYPVAAKITEIAQDFQDAAESTMVGLQIFPNVPSETLNVRWFQEDNAFGIMQFRGLDGQPGKVQALGQNIYDYEAGVYGERMEITEREYTTRASIADPTARIDITNLVMRKEMQLKGRLARRKEANTWTLLTTGTINIPQQGPLGTIIYKDSYAIQTYNALVPWSLSATATPILDIQNIQQKYVGHSVNFGAGAKLYMNQVTANRMLNNQNQADFAGRRAQYGMTFNDLSLFNNYFSGQNLPSVVVYDNGYQTIPLNGPNVTPNAGNFIKYIPDGVGVLVGQRPAGQNVGEWQITFNAISGGSAPYAFVKDSFAGTNTPKEVPGKIEVHSGFNGGLAIQFPSAIVAFAIG